jgi:hypothetical protein
LVGPVEKMRRGVDAVIGMLGSVVVVSGGTRVAVAHARDDSMPVR